MSDVGAKTVALIKENAEYQEASLEPSKEILKVWKKVHADMRSEFGEAVFRSWLKPLSLQAFYHGTMEVSVPTRFMRDWIQNHYADRILAMCAEANEEIKRLQIVVVQGAILDDVEEAPVDATPAKANQNEQSEMLAEISSPLDERFKFENFVVGKPNALAHAAARRVVESDVLPFNPLFIYGGVGLGKTHLMHAVGNAMMLQNHNAKIVYLHSERFVADMVKALQLNAINEFKRFYRSVDALLIDDIQFFAGKLHSTRSG